MMKDRYIIILLASVITGITINRSWECIEYYGGKLQGISAIFSTLSEYGNLPVNSLFTPNDIPTYHTYSKHDCPYCKSGQKIDALVNGHGYSELLSLLICRFRIAKKRNFTMSQMWLRSEFKMRMSILNTATTEQMGYGMVFFRLFSLNES